MKKFGIMVKGVISFENKILIVQRWYDDRITDPYQWEFIDAKIEFGESPDQAVIRAVNEATGLLPIIDKILYSWSYIVGDTQNIGISYLCSSFVDDIVLSENYTDFKWVDINELKDYIENQSILEDLSKAGLE